MRRSLVLWVHLGKKNKSLQELRSDLDEYREGHSREREGHTNKGGEAQVHRGIWELTDLAGDRATDLTWRSPKGALGSVLPRGPVPGTALPHG